MDPEAPIPAQAILRAQHELARRGPTRLLDELEEAQPDLAEHLMESLSLIHRDLLNLGGPAKASQRLQRRIEMLLLECLTALRRGDPPHEVDTSDKPGPPASD